jgi:hypothetical protein
MLQDAASAVEQQFVDQLPASGRAARPRRNRRRFLTSADVTTNFK